MPETATIDNQTDAKKAAKPGHDGYDPNMVSNFVQRIESVQAEIDEIAQKAKDEQAPHRDDIKEIKREAADAGLPRKELNAIIQQRKLERKAAGVPENLTEEQREQFDLMIGCLAGTPLAEAARPAS